MRYIKNILFFLIGCFVLMGADWQKPQGGQQSGGWQSKPVELFVEMLTDSIYMVKGGMANTGVIVGKNSVMAIDAGLNVEQGGKILAEIKKITSLPVTKMILTHSDMDHVNGLPAFPFGMEIIAQAICKQDMEAACKAPEMQSLQAYLPGKTFTDKMQINFEGEKIEMFYFGPAHTSSDITIFFPDKRLAFIGDVAITKDPVVHLRKKGSSTGTLNTLKQLLTLKADKYVAGHDTVLLKSDLEKVINGIEEKQAKIKALIKEGKTLEEVKQALGVMNGPAFSSGFRLPSLVEVIYQEFSVKK